MTRLPDMSVIERLSRAPITAENFITRLHQAAIVCYGGCALALVRNLDAERIAVIGAVRRDGTILLNPSTDLAHTSGLLTRRDAPAGDCAPLDTVRADGASPRWLDLTLGLRESVSVLLAGPAAQSDAARHEADLAFMLIASNLLRRAERVHLVEAQAWINEELGRLVELQEALKPETLDGFPRLELSVFSRPHRYAGGDYFDVSCMPGEDGERQVAIALADVAGHGPAAAAEAAMIDTVMRTFSGSQAVTERGGPAAVMTYLNEHMFSRRPRPTFATAFLGLWMPGARRLRYTVAGHPPPVFRPREGPARWLDIGDGIPINILRDFVWHERSLDAAPGDMLVLYTDGITEALSPGGEPFGADALLAAVDAAAPEPAAVESSVRNALDQHTACQANADDQTLLVAEFS